MSDSLATTAPSGGKPGYLRSIAAAWEWFWFKPTNPTTLGLIRILAGLLTIYIHLCYTFDLRTLMQPDGWVSLETIDEFRRDAPVFAPPWEWEQDTAVLEKPITPEQDREYRAYYERWGADPRLATAKGRYLWSLWYHVTDPTAMVVAHWAIIGIFVLLTIGLWTRITSALAFMAVLSYIHRSPTSLFGMDTFMVIVLFYLMIGPSGAALSVDRWLARRRGDSGPLKPSTSANFALRLLQIHFCIVYLAAGTSKLQGGMWWSGTAPWGTLANYEFSPMNIPAYDHFLLFLAQHRWLWEVCMSAGTIYTLLLEIGFPFMVWMPRLRPAMIVGAVLLHTGIALGMGLIVFSMFMVVMVMSFLPGDAVERGLNRVAALFRQMGGRFDRLMPGNSPAREPVSH